MDLNLTDLEQSKKIAFVLGLKVNFLSSRVFLGNTLLSVLFVFNKIGICENSRLKGK
jgi:hypothetical protein